jgi:hypothetical protein
VGGSRIDERAGRFYSEIGKLTFVEQGHILHPLPHFFLQNFNLLLITQF